MTTKNENYLIEYLDENVFYKCSKNVEVKLYKASSVKNRDGYCLGHMHKDHNFLAFLLHGWQFLFYSCSLEAHTGKLNFFVEAITAIPLAFSSAASFQESFHKPSFFTITELNKNTPVSFRLFRLIVKLKSYSPHLKLHI